jgi:hypothetical protein
MRMKGLALSFLVLSLVASGCGPKKKPGPEDATSGPSDQKLPGGSLEAYESGRRPPGDSGPLKDVHFAFDSYELDEQARQVLRDSADWLKDNSKLRIEIQDTATSGTGVQPGAGRQARQSREGLSRRSAYPPTA